MPKWYLKILGFSAKASDILFIVSLLFVIILLILPILKVNAQMKELETVAENAGLKGETDITLIIARIVRIVLSFLSLVVVILIIYAGFLWMTSGGNEEKIMQSKRIMAAAIIGLGIVLISATIFHFVWQRLVEVSK